MTTTPHELHRLAAFTDDPRGGNPAGVWIGDALPPADHMQRVAAEVGYSETAFLAPAAGRAWRVRYFSPLAEVPFCGHATIASGVVLGRRSGSGTYTLATRAGDVRVQVEREGDMWRASLQSVPTQQRPVPAALLDEALAALDWRRGELDPLLPPMLAYAGVWHLVLAVAQRQRLEQLRYDFERLKTLMLAHALSTLQLVWRESPTRFHARNPFPVGGVVEDPATGAAAAALGGYLRDAGLMPVPDGFQIIQGAAMGRPSLLVVTVPAEGGIIVSGTAVDMPAGD
ncbi:PhzF family phenazine biosynthesis protein [Luteimonas sp. A482]